MNRTADFIGTGNVSCERHTFTTGLPIPDHLSVFVTKGEGNDTAMTRCCEGNPVNVVNSCYIWCNLPAHYYLNRTDKPTEQSMDREFRSCFDLNGGYLETYKVYLPSSATASKAISLSTLLLVAWLAALFVFCL